MPKDPSSQAISWIVNFTTIFSHVYIAARLNECKEFLEFHALEEPIAQHLGASSAAASRRTNEQTSCQNGPSADLARQQASVHSSGTTAGNLSASSKHEAASGSISLPARFIFFSSIMFNFYLMLKYAVLCSLDSGLLDEHLYLDCFLTGRVLFDGRAVSLARYIALLVSSANIGWRGQMLLSGAKYDMSVIQFLAAGSERVLAAELAEAEQLLKLQQQQKHKQPLRPDRSLFGRDFGDRLILIRCGFKQRQANRTSAAWSFIAHSLQHYAIIMLIICTLLALSLSIVQNSLYLTRTGFEVTYERCVAWCTQAAAARKSLLGERALDGRQRFALAYIYEPPSSHNYTPATEELQMFWIGYRRDDWLQFNWFHLVRIFITLIETLTFELEIAASFCSVLVLTIVITRECRYYIMCLIEQLAELRRLLDETNLRKSIYKSIGTLAGARSGEQASEATRALDDSWQSPPVWSRFELRLNARYKLAAPSMLAEQASDEASMIGRRIQLLQLMMIDMFKTIRSNNVFMSEITIFWMFVWFTFSALATSWMFREGSFLTTSKLECYIVHTFATIYCMLIIGTTTKVRYESNRLYKLVVNCMAIDNEHPRSKMRWVGIMRFYYPIRLNCFTAFAKSDLSWAFALKVITWLFSGLFIVSTFYNYYR